MNLYGVQKIYILYLYLDVFTDRRTDSFNAQFLSDFFLTVYKIVKYSLLSRLYRNVLDTIERRRRNSKFFSEFLCFTCIFFFLKCCTIQFFCISYELLSCRVQVFSLYTFTLLDKPRDNLQKSTWATRWHLLKITASPFSCGHGKVKNRLSISFLANMCDSFLC